MVWEWINGKIERIERDLIIDPGNEFIATKGVEYLERVGERLWVWTVEVLPDIMGYGTMVTGAMVILGSMVGRGGIMKPLGYLSGGVILSLCILMTAKG